MLEYIYKILRMLMNNRFSFRVKDTRSTKTIYSLLLSLNRMFRDKEMKNIGLRIVLRGNLLHRREMYT